MAEPTEIIIHQVFGVTKSGDCYLVDIDLTDKWGMRDRVEYACRADDPYGANPVIWAWMQEHPEYL